MRMFWFVITTLYAYFGTQDAQNGELKAWFVAIGVMSFLLFINECTAKGGTP